MPKRYVSLWFRHLLADWMVRLRPGLKDKAFVFSAPDHGRMVVKAVNAVAQHNGIYPGMVVADCRAIYPELEVLDDIPGQEEKLLTAIAEWCIRYTPACGIELPDSLVLDASGCTHLWGGEVAYLKDIIARLNTIGYSVRGAIADTRASAWAVAHFGKERAIIPPGMYADAIAPLPPEALRLEPTTIGRLRKLGLYKVNSFMNMPRPELRKRFGPDILTKLDRALGFEIDPFQPVQPIEPYMERLPCMEPIRTAPGIEIALQRLLETLCARLEKEGKGIRVCVFKAYRVDGNEQQISISTSLVTRSVEHLFKLFQIKIPSFQPDLGFELFTILAQTVEDIETEQGTIWQQQDHDMAQVAELLDKVGGKFGMGVIHRYLPAEHYWPERSIREAVTLEEEPTTGWRTDLPRPLHVLDKPERIEVTAPIPDYPPMNFRYQGELHTVRKADGPERIEQEWWIAQGMIRDYYCVEDQGGKRYWIFRSGHYHDTRPEWFLHGFFA